MSKQIFLTGIVDNWMAEDMRWSLRNSSESHIDIYISSVGGNVNDGFEIANLIEGINAKGDKEIHTHNLSHVDSIATVIFLSAPIGNRHIVQSSTMFKHEPEFSMAFGVNIKKTEKMKQALEIEKNRIADYYVKKIEGLEKEEALSLMAGETNLTAEKMLELNIVSSIEENFNIAAQRNLINTNHKSINTMGLLDMFKKGNPTALTTKDGTVIVGGELKVGTEVVANGNEELKEIYNLEDGQILNIKEGKIESIEEAKVEETKEDVSEIVAKVSKEVINVVGEQIIALETKNEELQNKLDEIVKGVTPSKPAKAEKKGEKQIDPNEDIQDTARKEIQAEMKAKREEAIKNQKND